MEKALQYVASGLGLALTAVVVVIAVGEGIPNPLTLPHPVQVEFAAMAIMMLGALLALKWNRVGGGLMLAGYAAFQGVEWAVNRRFFPFVLIFALIGLIHLLRPVATGISGQSHRDERPFEAS